MKAEIEARLQVLIGQPLTGGHRAADMEVFSFGEANIPLSRGGKSGLVSRYALHIQCPWRLVRSGAIVTGYDDLREPNSVVGASPDFDPNEVGQTLREELLNAFYSETRDHPRVVIGIETSEIGDLRVLLDGDCTLEVFPDRSSSGAAFTDPNSIGEHWRFLDKLGDHVVIGRDGLSIAPLVEES